MLTGEVVGMARWSGPDILALLDALGWSRAQLAARLHVHQITVERWLRGERRPMAVHIAALNRLSARAAKAEA